MKLPAIRADQSYKKQTVTFKGLNLTQNYSDGEFSETDGISQLAFPAITQRRKYEKLDRCTAPVLAGVSDKEFFVDGGKLIYDGKTVGDVSAGEKLAAVLGSYITVFPDKVFYNTKKKEFGSLEAKHTYINQDVVFTATGITVPKKHYEIISEPETLLFLISAPVEFYASADVSFKTGTLTLGEKSEKAAARLVQNDIITNECESNQYRVVTEVSAVGGGSSSVRVMTILNTIITINHPSLEDIRDGDAVCIEGCTVKPDNNKTAIVQQVSEDSLTFQDDTFEACTETAATVTIRRKIPDFSCVCAYENRLWGCEGNTIYASKLGDPLNFFVFNSVSTDSYSIESNTPGDFTACVPYGSQCIFFKENAIYKLFGSRPSNFQLTESFGEGIGAGNQKSIAAHGGKMFYCSGSGVYSYYGGMPQLISQKLGSLRLRNAAGGCNGRCYFVAADTGSGRKMFVYDIEKGMWSIAGKTTAFDFAFYGGKLYAMCEDGMYEITEAADDGVQWSVTLCPFDENYYKTKNYSRLRVCAQLFENAWLSVETSADGAPWETAANVYGKEKRYVNIPIKRICCNELRIRLTGKGRSIIESVVREFSVD